MKNLLVLLLNKLARLLGYELVKSFNALSYAQNLWIEEEEDFTEDNSFCTETIDDDLSDLDFIDENEELEAEEESAYQAWLESNGDIPFDDEEDYCSTNRCAECVVLNEYPPCQDSISYKQEPSPIQWEDELEHGKVIVICSEYIGQCIPDLCHSCCSCTKQEQLEFLDK